MGNQTGHERETIQCMQIDLIQPIDGSIKCYIKPHIKTTTQLLSGACKGGRLFPGAGIFGQSSNTIIQVEVLKVELWQLRSGSECDK